MGAASSSNKHTTSTSSPSSPLTTKHSYKNFPIVGPDDVMRKKKHGTSDSPVQESLRWNISRSQADKICNYNRHYAEQSGSAFANPQYREEFEKAKQQQQTLKFYDSVTGALLFEAAKNRSHDQFDRESRHHGWPSFRDDEVNWEHVRCLKNGECVSLTGTHLVSVIQV